MRIKKIGWKSRFYIFDSNPIAYEYGFNINGRFEDWRGGYDKNFSKLAPGKIIFLLLLKDIFEKGTYKDLDFLRGEYFHKERWLPSNRNFLNIVSVHPNHIPALLALNILPKLKNWVKKLLNKKNNKS